MNSSSTYSNTKIKGTPVNNNNNSQKDNSNQ